MKMRRAILASICVVLSSWSATARAQSGGRPFYVGANVELKNVPVDVSKALKPSSSYGQSLLGSSSKTALSTMNFANLFRNSAVPSWPPPTVTSTVLPQAQNIFQPNPLKGKNPTDGGKILGNGKLTGPVNVTAHAISASAKAAIEAAGGSVTIVQ